MVGKAGLWLFRILLARAIAGGVWDYLTGRRYLITRFRPRVYMAPVNTPLPDLGMSWDDVPDTWQPIPLGRDAVTITFDNPVPREEYLRFFTQPRCARCGRFVLPGVTGWLRHGARYGPHHLFKRRR